jgi:hypothetical protein
MQQAAAAADLDPGAAAVSSAGPKDRQLAALEARYVHSVYDAIAPHFASTRFAVWPRVRAFLEAVPPGALLADVGCGNGKYFGVRRDVFVLGSDRSEGGALALLARALSNTGSIAAGGSWRAAGACLPVLLLPC